jgi:predicted metal-dependent hydrolase
MDVDQLAFGPPPVEVRRSTRRRRTVSAYREGETIVVLLPARMTRAEERHWVEVMTERLAARERRSRPTDTELLRRARSLAARYLDAGGVEPASVRWVDNQGSRWGSCTAEDRTIRLSSRLRSMPAYVVDYVLLHELAHLVVPAHGPAFWALLEGYPRTERARGYLDGWSTACAEGEAGGPERLDGGSVDGADDDGAAVEAVTVGAESVARMLDDEASA